jgi:hypothetical protein
MSPSDIKPGVSCLIVAVRPYTFVSSLLSVLVLKLLAKKPQLELFAAN